MIKLSQIVLKGVNWVHNDKIRSNGFLRSELGTQYKKSIGYTMIKLGQMVLRGFNCIHNDKIRSYGLERSHLGTQ